ncbi:uncharacterized protein [Lepisosteus oculatus]|uniref:uncharacterized protein n=1 Tax=Lepisosteus oculatus TaxID=7918 RepID=UPI0037158E88
MLQQNNNNNYSCLERGRGSSSRKIISEAGAEGGGPPFTSLLQVASFQEFRGTARPAPKTKGFRSWAVSSVCAKGRKRAAAPKSDHRPCPQGADGATVSKTRPGNGTPAGANANTSSRLRKCGGRPAQVRSSFSLGVQINAATGICWRSPRSRASNVGSLVTVATLKASEGSKTQTQCFFLQSDAKSYCCATRSHYKRPSPYIGSEFSTQTQGKSVFVGGGRPGGSMTGEASYSGMERRADGVAERAVRVGSKQGNRAGQEGPALDVVTIDLSPVPKGDEPRESLPSEEKEAGDQGEENEPGKGEGKRETCTVPNFPEAEGRENTGAEKDGRDCPSTPGQVQMLVQNCAVQRGSECPGSRNQKRPPVGMRRAVSKEHNHMSRLFREEEASVVPQSQPHHHCCSLSECSRPRGNVSGPENAAKQDVQSEHEPNSSLARLAKLTLDDDKDTDQDTRDFKGKVTVTLCDRKEDWQEKDDTSQNVSLIQHNQDGSPWDLEEAESRNPRGLSEKLHSESVGNDRVMGTSDHTGRGLDDPWEQQSSPDDGLARPFCRSCSAVLREQPQITCADDPELRRGNSGSDQTTQFVTSDCIKEWLEGAEDFSRSKAEDSPGPVEMTGNTGMGSSGSPRCESKRRVESSHDGKWRECWREKAKTSEKVSLPKDYAYNSNKAVSHTTTDTRERTNNDGNETGLNSQEGTLKQRALVTDFSEGTDRGCRSAGNAEPGEADSACFSVCANSPSRGPGTAAAARAPAGPNPSAPVTMVTLSAQERSLPEVEGRLLPQHSMGEPHGHRSTAANERGSPDIEQGAGDDEFGVFVQAGEPFSWDDSFTDFRQVPCGLRESNEEVWTAFPQEGSDGQNAGEEKWPPSGPAGQWWHESALEEPRSTPLDLAALFRESFPSTGSSFCEAEHVPTLHQLLQRKPGDKDATGEERCLLEGLQDVNEMIGFRIKWAESVSQTLLLHSLRIDPDSRESVENSWTMGDSPSHSQLKIRQWSPADRNTKTKLSYDINKNVLA